MLAVYLGFQYNHAYTSKERIGQVRDVGGAFGASGNTYNLTADVDDYQSYTGRLGVKLPLPPDKLPRLPVKLPFRPYLNASAGGKHVDQINISLYTGGNATFVGNPRLFDDSWVFTAQVGSGTEIFTTRSFTIGIEGNPNYDGHMDDPNGGFAGTSNEVNQGGDRLYFSTTADTKVWF